MKPMLRLPGSRTHRFKLWLLLPLLLLLASCATTGGCVTKPDPCAGWSPIYVSRTDVLSDGTAKQILAHDEHGKQVCGWGKGH
jgi:hypothetical protein